MTEQQKHGEAASLTSQDDWLAGADVEARAEGVSLGEVDVSLEGLEPPESTGPNVA